MLVSERGAYCINVSNDADVADIFSASVMVRSPALLAGA